MYDVMPSFFLTVMTFFPTVMPFPMMINFRRKKKEEGREKKEEDN